jgi:hypothetical protein
LSNPMRRLAPPVSRIPAKERAEAVKSPRAVAPIATRR